MSYPSVLLVRALLGQRGPGLDDASDAPGYTSRFLRARRWAVPDAYRQFKDTEDWRAANHLNVLYDTIDVDAYEQSRLLVRCHRVPNRRGSKYRTDVFPKYPQWTGRRDKR